MAREKYVRLSKDEHQALTEYRNSNYHDGVVFGAVIKDLIEEQE